MRLLALITLSLFAQAIFMGQQTTPKAVMDPAGIFNSKGQLVTKNYITMAANWGTGSMIAERYGKTWFGYHATDPSVSAPTLYDPPLIHYQDPITPQAFWDYTIVSANGICSSDDFASSYDQVAYIYNKNVTGSAPGVDGVQTIQKDKCTWSALPQLDWAVGSGHNGHPTVTFRDVTPKPVQAVDIARAPAGGEAKGCSYIAFQNGTIGTGEGGNTAECFNYGNNGVSSLPTIPFVPTAMCVTANGEFILVIGWNTTTFQGQLGVIAVGSWRPSGASGVVSRYEFPEDYPGFRNYSIPNLGGTPTYGFFKYLGTVTLTGMAAPTMIEATGNWVYRPGQFFTGSSLPQTFPLSTNANWTCFATGTVHTTCGDYDLPGYDTRGFALIASRWEKKVIIVDLTPLFGYISTSMFTSFSNFTTNMGNIGTGVNTYPATFAENSSETPKIVHTMTFSQPVTAVSASLWPDNRAFIATDDATLRVWDVDGIQTGTGTDGAAASQIQTLTIGNNTTRIAHMAHWIGTDYLPPGGGEVRYQYLLMSRGDKSVKIMDMSTGTATILSTMTDSRMVDPISVEDTNNHSATWSVMDVADYGGMAVLGYRYGALTVTSSQWGANSGSPFGMGATGMDSFEYEGEYPTVTGPFALSQENVP